MNETCGLERVIRFYNFKTKRQREVKRNLTNKYEEKRERKSPW